MHEESGRKTRGTGYVAMFLLYGLRRAGYRVNGGFDEANVEWTDSDEEENEDSKEENEEGKELE